MKKTSIVILVTFALSLSGVTAFAQKTKMVTKTTTKVSPAKQQTSSGKTVSTSTQKPEPLTQPLTMAEKMPEFPGGGQAMEQYFVKATSGFKIYQPAGIKMTLELNPAGKVTRAEVKNGYRKYENGIWLEYPEIDKTLEEAALKMPAWEPAMDKGKPVNFQHDIHFSVMSQEEAQTQSDKVFTFVEQQPQFPGGDAKMMEFIAANLQYPADAQANKQEGLVIVQFVITRFGEITDATILKSFAESAGNETLRIVRAMPRWTPGKQNGRPVAVRFTLPVRFKL